MIFANSEISLCIAKILLFQFLRPLRKFRYGCESFPPAAASHFFNPGFKICTQTAKINTRKIKKNCIKVNINLKTRIN